MSGFDGLTMSGLAREAGLAKGTLYLYVRTKEEVFALILADDIDRFTAGVVPHAGSDEALIDAIVSQVGELPLLLPLLARLTTTIEINLSEEVLIAVKRTAWQQLKRIAEALIETRNMPEAVAVDVTQALFLALQGAAQSCVRPSTGIDTLPADVREIYARSDFDRTYRLVARLVLAGAARVTSPA